MLADEALGWGDAQARLRSKPDDREAHTEVRRAFLRLGPGEDENTIEAAIAAGDAALLTALYQLWRGRHSVEIKNDPQGAPVLRQLERMAAVIGAARRAGR